MSSVPPGESVQPRRMRTALRGLGLLALCAFAADVLWFQFVETEKSAHYLFGYWFDAVWTVQLPLLITGLVAIVAGFLLGRGEQGARP